MVQILFPRPTGRYGVPQTALDGSVGQVLTGRRLVRPQEEISRTQLARLTAMPEWLVRVLIETQDFRSTGKELAQPFLKGAHRLVQFRKPGCVEVHVTAL